MIACSTVQDNGKPYLVSRMADLPLTINHLRVHGRLGRQDQWQDHSRQSWLGRALVWLHAAFRHRLYRCRMPAVWTGSDGRSGVHEVDHGEQHVSKCLHTTACIASHLALSILLLASVPDLVNIFVADQLVSSLSAATGDDTEHARWQASLQCELTKPQACQWCLLRHLKLMSPPWLRTHRPTCARCISS